MAAAKNFSMTQPEALRSNSNSKNHTTAATSQGRKTNYTGQNGPNAFMSTAVLSSLQAPASPSMNLCKMPLSKVWSRQMPTTDVRTDSMFLTLEKIKTQPPDIIKQNFPQAHLQKDIVYQLSSARPTNTDLHLIGKTWWQEWCRYTGYFRLNASNGKRSASSSRTKVRKQSPGELEMDENDFVTNELESNGKPRGDQSVICAESDMSSLYNKISASASVSKSLRKKAENMNNINNFNALISRMPGKI